MAITAITAARIQGIASGPDPDLAGPMVLVVVTEGMLRSSRRRPIPRGGSVAFQDLDMPLRHNSPSPSISTT